MIDPTTLEDLLAPLDGEITPWLASETTLPDARTVDMTIRDGVEWSDGTPLTPQTSYGTQKLVCEHLVADYTRKGFIDGRAARLMTVTVRPGRPNGAASSFFSGIIREPLAGVESVCPVSPEVSHPVSSPSRTVDGLIAVYETNLAEQVAASIKAANRVISRQTDMAADQLAADIERAEAEGTAAAVPQQAPRSADAAATMTSTGG